LYLQPFTNSHFHFFITVESAISEVMYQRLKQVEVRQGKVRTVGWIAHKFLVKRLQHLLWSACTVWGCIIVLKDHTSRQMLRSLPEKILTQLSQCVAVSVRFGCCLEAWI
jgi:hypothetical protein